jgi:uncharacterized protein
MIFDLQHPLFRVSGISYLHIPAGKPRQSARFYATVFGWSLGGSPSLPSFEDGTGHVIGKFVGNQAPVGEDGVRPYIYVENIDETVARIGQSGGEIVTAPFPEGDLAVALFRDPAGNVLGIWQHGSPRTTVAQPRLRGRGSRKR